MCFLALGNAVHLWEILNQDDSKIPVWGRLFCCFMVRDVVPYANKDPRIIYLYLRDLLGRREESPNQFCLPHLVGEDTLPEL